MRITFPGRAWREWLSGDHTVQEAGGGREVKEVPVFARDVAYMGRDRVGLYWNASSNKKLLQKHTVRALHEALPAGVKHYAWKYEQECAMRHRHVPLPREVYKRQALYTASGVF